MSKAKKKNGGGKNLPTSLFVEQLMMNSSYDSFGKKISPVQAESELEAAAAATTPEKEQKDKRKPNKIKKSVSNLETLQTRQHQHQHRNCQHSTDTVSDTASTAGSGANSVVSAEGRGHTHHHHRHHHKKGDTSAAAAAATTTTATSSSFSSSVTEEESYKDDDDDDDNNNDNNSSSNTDNGNNDDEGGAGNNAIYSTPERRSHKKDKGGKGDAKKATVGDPAVSPTKPKLFSKRRSLGVQSSSLQAQQQQQQHQQQPLSMSLSQLQLPQQSSTSSNTGSDHHSYNGKKDESRLYYDKQSSKDEGSDSEYDYYFDAMSDVIDDDHHKAPLGYETMVKMDGWIRKTFTDKSNRRKERRERDSFESERGSEHNKKTIIPSIFLLKKKKKKDKDTGHRKMSSGISDDVRSIYTASTANSDESGEAQPARSLSQPQSPPEPLSGETPAPVSPDPASEIAGTSGLPSTTIITASSTVASEQPNNGNNNADVVDDTEKERKRRVTKQIKATLRKSHATAVRLTQLERRVGEAESCMPGKIRDDVITLCKTLSESAEELRGFMGDPGFERFMDEQRRELAQTEQSVAALKVECAALGLKTQENDQRTKLLRIKVKAFDKELHNSWSEKAISFARWLFSGLSIDMSYNSVLVCGLNVSTLRKWLKLF